MLSSYTKMGVKMAIVPVAVGAIKGEYNERRPRAKDTASLQNVMSAQIRYSAADLHRMICQGICQIQLEARI